MLPMDHHNSFDKDIEAVKNIPIILDVICQTTGMGFAAVARVTEDRWVACSVMDKVNFGLEQGSELPIETTLCNEVQSSLEPIVVDNFQKDAKYKKHHTPEIYGLQSYISIPIILRDNTFFGTLCAIDSKPAKINNNKVISTFKMFAELLAFHLESLDLLERSNATNQALVHKNKALHMENTDLDNFVYTASHDLKSPLANVEGLLDALAQSIDAKHFDRNSARKIINMMQSSLVRFKLTIKDLTAIVEADNLNSDVQHANTNIDDIVALVKQDLQGAIESSAAVIELRSPENLFINQPKKAIKSILYNLISNAIKYSSPKRKPVILVDLVQEAGKIYLSVTDNGLGIPEDKREHIFTMFKRYHNHVEGSGLGLYLVKRMVNNLHGHIKLDSVEGEGTTFTIIL